MFANLLIRPAGNLGPHEYSNRRTVILDRIAKSRLLHKQATTKDAKSRAQQEIQVQVKALQRLNEQQQVEMNDSLDASLDLELELEEVVEGGFEIVDVDEEC